GRVVQRIPRTSLERLPRWLRVWPAPWKSGKDEGTLHPPGPEDLNSQALNGPPKLRGTLACVTPLPDGHQDFINLFVR
ncbi:unnamed protein product, partial [Symbiodinium natans]